MRASGRSLATSEYCEELAAGRAARSNGVACYSRGTSKASHGNAESGNLLVAEMRDFAVAYGGDVAAGD